jgi:hypothetical protein
VMLLPTGQVLVAGGLDEHDTPLQSAELYDAEAQSWTPVPEMNAARASSTAALLPTGEVLVAGGTDGGQAVLSSAEIYDPKEGHWREAGFLKTGRKAHRAMLLPTGRVLIIGGSNGRSALDGVEMYDPQRKTWTVMEKLTTPREDSLTVLLPSGQVLVIAGSESGVAKASTERVTESDDPRPQVKPVQALRPRSRFQVEGKGFKGPLGNVPQLRLQTLPAGALIDLEATDITDTSAQATLPQVHEGFHMLFVVANGVAGGQVVHVDGTPPAAPSVAPFNPVLNTPKLTLEGTAEPLSQVRVFVDRDEAGHAPANEEGKWTVSLTLPQKNGTHTIWATATDAASNTSQDSDKRTVTVDTTPPEAPQLSPFSKPLKTAWPTLSGTAERGSQVTVQVDGKEEGTARADTEGRWSLIVRRTQRDGTHKASAVAVDEAGNTGPASAVLTFTVDTVAPGEPQVLEPQDRVRLTSLPLTVRGVAEPGSTVTVSVDDQKQGTVLADAEGHWSLSVAELKDGDHTVSATATDAAVNISASSQKRGFTVDTQAEPLHKHEPEPMGCAAGPGEPSLALLGLMLLGEYLRRRASGAAVRR